MAGSGRQPTFPQVSDVTIEELVTTPLVVSSCRPLAATVGRYGTVIGPEVNGIIDRMTPGQPTDPLTGGLRQRAALAPLAARPVALLAAGVALVLSTLSGRYGFHRDELYFLVAGQHPAWGYVDQPPLTPLLARASTALFGDTVVGLRVASTALYVGIVVLAALIARELGSARRGQFIAAAGTAASSVVLTVGHMVSTETFDIFAWLLISQLALRLLRTGDGRWFLPIGAAVGIGVLNKYLVLLLPVGLLAALLILGARRVLRSGWLVAAAMVAVLIALPNLWWQAEHDWPQLTVASGIDEKQGVENRVLFLPLQLVYLSPLFLPVWAAGLVRLWRDPAVRWARAFALAYPLLAALVLAMGGKAYYVIPMLIVIFAAGVEPAVNWAHSAGRRRALAVCLVLAALVNVVATLPVLPPTALNVMNSMNKEQGEQVGWPELVGAVALAWHQIPVEQRGRAVIFTQNYGQASAIARYGPAEGLPKPYSGHMSYADWGPPPDAADGPVLVVRYPGNRSIGQHFTECRPVATVDNGYGLDNDEQGTVIDRCAGPRTVWSSLWPALRHYY